MIDNPIVSVIVCTYNQEKYIRQAIDSILSQKTDYSFEILIGEDYGSDATLQICKEYEKKYQNIFVPDRGRNLGVTLNFIDLLKRAKGEYLLFCDGDDFWSSSDKIQVQVDYMENHPECILSHTDLNTLYENTGYLKEKCGGTMPILSVNDMQKALIAGTYNITSGTCCFRRRDALKNIPFDIYEKENFPCEDWPTHVILSAYGEIHYFPFVSYTYRIGQQSIMHDKNYDRIRIFYKRAENMTRVLFEMFPENLGKYEDSNNYLNFQDQKKLYRDLLIAAYDNSDFASAKSFAPKTTPIWAAKMANNRLTFELFRLWRNFKTRL